MVCSSERYYRYLSSERTTTTVEFLIWCQCYSNNIIITAWFYRLGNLILLVLLMMQPFNFCEVYAIIILRLCSFKLGRVFLLKKCFVMGEKWLWNVLLDCFQLPGKSVFSEHKHARNVALIWLILPLWPASRKLWLVYKFCKVIFFPQMWTFAREHILIDGDIIMFGRGFVVKMHRRLSKCYRGCHAILWNVLFHQKH